MKRRAIFNRAALAAALAVSLWQGWVKVREWTPRPPSEFDLFVEEARAAIPAGARVLVVVPGGARLDRHANYLSGRLHPRACLFAGRADWVIELPAGEFKRSEASIRKAAP